ncbi:hypothetical protein [Streptomyces sp. NPDC002952]
MSYAPQSGASPSFASRLDARLAAVRRLRGSTPASPPSGNSVA